MNIYIAAPWIDRDQMPQIAELLEKAGHTISHKWWGTENIPESEKTVETHRKHAELDFNGVRNADLILLMNTSKSEGKAVEQGVALSYGKPIIAVGERGAVSKNVFHYMSQYKWVPSLDEALKVIETLQWAVDNASKP